MYEHGQSGKYDVVWRPGVAVGSGSLSITHCETLYKQVQVENLLDYSDKDYSGLPPFDIKVFFNQNPERFKIKIHRCFSRKEITALSKGEAKIIVWPIMLRDGTIPELSEIVVEGDTECIKTVSISSFAKLERAFCRFFTVEDGGALQKLEADFYYLTGVSFIVRDGEISIYSSIPWRDSVDIERIRMVEEATGLDYKI